MLSVYYAWRFPCNCFHGIFEECGSWKSYTFCPSSLGQKVTELKYESEIVLIPKLMLFCTLRNSHASRTSQGFALLSVRGTMHEPGVKCCQNTKQKGAKEQIVSKEEDMWLSFEKNE